MHARSTFCYARAATFPSLCLYYPHPALPLSEEEGEETRKKRIYKSISPASSPLSLSIGGLEVCLIRLPFFCLPPFLPSLPAIPPTHTLAFTMVKQGVTGTKLRHITLPFPYLFTFWNGQNRHATHFACTAIFHGFSPTTTTCHHLPATCLGQVPAYHHTTLALPLIPPPTQFCPCPHPPCPTLPATASSPDSSTYHAHPYAFPVLLHILPPTVTVLTVLQTKQEHTFLLPGTYFYHLPPPWDCCLPTLPIPLPTTVPMVYLPYFTPTLWFPSLPACTLHDVRMEIRKSEKQHGSMAAWLACMVCCCMLGMVFSG